MDVLTDALDSLRLKGSVYCYSELGAPWSMRFMPTHCASFHVVAKGEGWLQIEDMLEPIQLCNGDLVVLPHGPLHSISHIPNWPPIVDIQLDDDGAPMCLREVYDNGGAHTTLICGTFDFHQQDRHPLIAFLPPLLHIRGEEGRTSDWLDMTLKFLANEAGSERPGTETLLKRLADILFVQAMRVWIEQPSQRGGWVGALRDPQIGRALSLIHGHPERRWTLASLAREVAMSRSAFAARFTDLVGESLFQYLTRCRMQIACCLLEENELKMIDIAKQVGYESEAAFHKAFKRTFDVNPGAYRRQQVGSSLGNRRRTTAQLR